MSSWIHSKPLEHIVWADLDKLIAEQVTEGPQIEFKGAIPDKNGNQDPWVSSRKVPEYGRDKICQELSAFLNSYGGTLFLGVEEGPKAPRPAVNLAPRPEAEELVKRFEDLVRSHFDPPVAGIAIKAVMKPGGENGEGVIVFRAQPSNLAPHGFGRPAVAYVRRGASSDPMSMRDLQSVFWETRTRTEWVAQTRERFDRQRTKLMQKYPNAPTIAFRISAVPQGRLAGLNLFRWPDEMEGHAIRPSSKELGIDDQGAWHRGPPQEGWRLKGQGIWAQESAPEQHISLTEIEETGAVSVSALLFGRRSPPRFQNSVFRHYTILSPLLQCMFAAEILRRRAFQPNIPIELDVTIATRGEIYASLEGDFVSDNDLMPIFELSEIGPLTWTRREELGLIYTELEKQITAACGLPLLKPKTPNFDQAFAAKEHHFIPKG